MNKKTKTILKAIGLWFGINALSYGFLFGWWWFATSAVGVWLEINRPTRHSPAGALYVLPTIVFLITIMMAVSYYRDRMKDK